MQAKQLSVFIENREGRLDEVLAVIKAANVNIMSNLPSLFSIKTDNCFACIVFPPFY